MRRRVFVSAVSAELKRYRELAAQKLQLRGIVPVFQETFGLTDQKIVTLLRDKIVGTPAEPGCDAMLCLVGDIYGAEPSAPLPGFPRRSFTQWEYFIAREKKIPIYRLLTSSEFQPPNPVSQSADHADLQLAYRQEITRDRNSRSFGNVHEFRAELGELRFPWEPPGDLGQPPCNLPASLGSLFIGRDEFLKTLRDKLTQPVAADRRALAITPRQAIHGLGGVGKTRLVVEYAHAYAGEYSALLHITADSPTSLVSNLAELTGVLQIAGLETEPDERRIAAVCDWLNQRGEWFLLFDNVDSAEAANAVIEVLNRLRGGHVVITSRLSNWPALIEPLQLDVVSPENAVAYLQQAAPQRSITPDDAEQARRLAEEVDRLALALEQSAAYVKRFRISFAEYRERWQTQGEKVRGWYDPRVMQYPRSVATTWNTTVDQLTASARSLLELLSWFSPEPLRRAWLMNESAAQSLAVAGVHDVEEALVELADVSMIRLDQTELSVHRLVQEVTRERMEPERRNERMERVFALLDAIEPGDPTDVRNWPVWNPLAPHVADLVDRVDKAGQTQRAALWMNELGLFYKQRIRFPEAEQLYRRALAIDEHSYGAEHARVAIDLNNLAQLLQATNRLSEAEPLMARVVRIFEKSLGENHPNVATALNNLAQLLKATNRLSEAEPLMRRALVIDEHSYGPDHPDVARDLNNLAQLLQATNRLAEAEPLMSRVVRIFALFGHQTGHSHPGMQVVIQNYRQLLEAIGLPAEEIDRRVREACGEP
ncbi:MAG: tetratricopeptide repeat protein [Planctomycetota bacterium]|nr:tetratricopeptide repeat protein [Planctomycetota bacterium]